MSDPALSIRGLVRQYQTDAELIEVYKKNGVEVTEMTKENYDAWLAIAKETSYKEFAEKVPNGQALIDAALAVE